MKSLQPEAALTRLGASVFLLAFLSFLLMGASPIPAAQNPGNSADATQENKPPSGTTLPVILGTSFSFDKCKPGQTLHGKIAKDVPLQNGSVIRKGSEVEGRIVEVTPAANGSGTNVAIQFDKLDVGGRKVPVVTNLQAIADNPPALWAFRVDARGNYGIDNLLIAHAGDTNPVGRIVLASQAQNLKLEKGDALLLLVD
ncbi:MAG TPA: hypothetical protein VGF61_04740 [Candidatus Acidoferrum sp.]